MGTWFWRRTHKVNIFQSFIKVIICQTECIGNRFTAPGSTDNLKNLLNVSLWNTFIVHIWCSWRRMRCMDLNQISSYYYNSVNTKIDVVEKHNGSLQNQRCKRYKKLRLNDNQWYQLTWGLRLADEVDVPVDAGFLCIISSPEHRSIS